MGSRMALEGGSACSDADGCMGRIKKESRVTQILDLSNRGRDGALF